MFNRSRKSKVAAISRDQAIDHLAEKFNIPASDMTASFEKKKGYRRGNEEYSDTFMITVKQPKDRPTLHHDMHNELVQVFSAYYGSFNPKNMRFYFGVTEDKEYAISQREAKPVKMHGEEPAL